MPLIFLILLLLLPLSDIYLAFSWLFESPLPAALYFAATTTLGVLMMKFAKIGFGEVMRLLQSGRAHAGMLAGFAGIWLTGVLLIFPGYLSDGAAVFLFILSWRKPEQPMQQNQSQVERDAHFHDTADNDEYDDERTPIEAEAEVIDEHRD